MHIYINTHTKDGEESVCIRERRDSVYWREKRRDVAACCSVLQCVAVCCSVLQVLQCVAVCCSVCIRERRDSERERGTQKMRKCTRGGGGAEKVRDSPSL